MAKAVMTVSNEQAATPTLTPTKAPDGAGATAGIDDVLILEDALVIQPWEITFAQTLHRLIPSPRAVKRLSNTYRILKARVRAERVARFEGTADAGRFPGSVAVAGDTDQVSRNRRQMVSRAIADRVGLRLDRAGDDGVAGARSAV